MKVLSVISFCLVQLANTASGQEVLAIRGVTLVDPRTGSAQADMTIVLEGGRIAVVGPTNRTPIPPNAPIEDGRGRWAIPGLVDVHNHRTDREELRRALALGVTTVHVLPSRPDTTLELEIWSSAADSPVPRVALTQYPFSGEWPDNLSPGRWALRIPATADQARRYVDDVRRAGFRRIKLYFDSGRLWWPGREARILDPAVVRAIVDRAHELVMPVLVHAPEATFARQAVNSGVNGLMHAVLDSVLDVALWREMRWRRIAWAPTLAAFIDLCEPPEYARRMLEDSRLKETLTARAVQTFERDTAATIFLEDSVMPLARRNRAYYIATMKQNTRLARDHGLTIAVGSDRTPGPTTHLEMQLLREAGLSPAEVLVAATYGGARTLGLENDIGTIEPGKRADIVLLRADPLVDIRNARATEVIIKGGRRYTRQELLRAP